MEINLLVTIAGFLIVQTGGLIWTLATLVEANKNLSFRVAALEAQRSCVNFKAPQA